MRDILLAPHGWSETVEGNRLKTMRFRNMTRNLALYTLLYKSLTRGRYADFLNADETVPKNAEQFGPYYGYQYEYDYGYEEDVESPCGHVHARD